MNLKKITLVLTLSCLLSSAFSADVDGNGWWYFLNKKYHFNIERNFDVFHEEGNGYSIIYLDLKFDNYVMAPQKHIIEKNGFDISKDFVIKYEKKETKGDIINYTNALLVNKGDNGHDACKASLISINKTTKEIVAKSCSFSRLFDDISKNPGFSDKKSKFSIVK